MIIFLEGATSRELIQCCLSTQEKISHAMKSDTLQSGEVHLFMYNKLFPMQSSPYRLKTQKLGDFRSPSKTTIKAVPKCQILEQLP
jgi:hypothetical protein